MKKFYVNISYFLSIFLNFLDFFDITLIQRN